MLKKYLKKNNKDKLIIIFDEIVSLYENVNPK